MQYKVEYKVKRSGIFWDLAGALNAFDSDRKLLHYSRLCIYTMQYLDIWLKGFELIFYVWNQIIEHSVLTETLSLFFGTAKSMYSTHNIN